MKSKGSKRVLGLLLLLCLGTTMAFGQRNLLYYNKVDTLTLGQRFNLRTNMVDWVALTPNIGVEFAVGNKNWNRWTVGAFGRFNWNTNSKQNAYYLYDLYDGRLEVRHYWHAKMPKRVYYVGAYAGANAFDIKLDATGRKGSSFFCGLMVGTITQLYGYQNGASLDLDLGVNAGVVFAKYKEYRRELVGNKYEYVTTAPEKGYGITFSPWIYAATTDVLKVSFVYHFGTKLANRYKKRILIDNNYRLALEAEKARRDSLNIVLEKRRVQRADSLERVNYEKRFEQQHLELEKKYQRDSLKVVNQAKAEEEAKAREKAKEEAKQRKIYEAQQRDSLREVNKQKAIEAANAKKLAKEQEAHQRDSLKQVEQAKAVEAANAKKLVKEQEEHQRDSLKQVEQTKAVDAVNAKKAAKEEAKRLKALEAQQRDSIKAANRAKQAEAAKEKKQKELEAKETQKVEKTTTTDAPAAANVKKEKKKRKRSSKILKNKVEHKKQLR